MKNKDWIIRITEPPAESSKSVKAVVSLETPVEEKRIGEKCLVYFKKDSASLQLQYGDILVVHTSFSQVAGPKNPYAFDNKAFLRRKGIYFQGYVSGEQWEKIARHPPNLIKQYAHSLMRFFSTRFSESGLSGDEYSIITAILLGNDETMDPELKAQYASAGVSHILCVSGLHVGIIFMILDFLLKPLAISHKTKITKACILLLAIWFYAHITGLAPSVMRAATMFSFVTLGSLMRRNTTIFHSLYASLLLLLLINPLLLFEVGFQLSYLAVFGIVILQKPIVRIWKPGTWFGNYLWELIAVSLAAQLATSPIAIFYFGQFPNYFLLANISIMFLSFLVIVTGVTLLFLSFFTFVAEFIGILLTYEIKLMNFIIKTIDGFPGAVTRNISIHSLQVILLYLFFGFIFYAIRRKSKKHLLFGLSAFALFSLFLAHSRYENSIRNEITVYSIPKSSVLNFNYHGKSILLADSLFEKDGLQYNFNIRNHEQKERITSEIHYFNQDFADPKTGFRLSGNFIYFNNMTFYMLTRDRKVYPTGKKIKVDYVYIHGNPRLSLEKILPVFDFSGIIIDESNSSYYENKWMEDCRQHRISCYSTRQQGFLKLFPSLQ